MYPNNGGNYPPQQQGGGGPPPNHGWSPSAAATANHQNPHPPPHNSHPQPQQQQFINNASSNNNGGYNNNGGGGQWSSQQQQQQQVVTGAVSMAPSYSNSQSMTNASQQQQQLGGMTGASYATAAAVSAPQNNSHLQGAATMNYQSSLSYGGAGQMLNNNMSPGGTVFQQQNLSPMHHQQQQSPQQQQQSYPYHHSMNNNKVMTNANVECQQQQQQLDQVMMNNVAQQIATATLGVQQQHQQQSNQMIATAANTTPSSVQSQGNNNIIIVGGGGGDGGNNRIITSPDARLTSPMGTTTTATGATNDAGGSSSVIAYFAGSTPPNNKTNGNPIAAQSNSVVAGVNETLSTTTNTATVDTADTAGSTQLNNSEGPNGNGATASNPSQQQPNTVTSSNNTGSNSNDGSIVKKEQESSNEKDDEKKNKFPFFSKKGSKKKSKRSSNNTTTTASSSKSTSTTTPKTISIPHDIKPKHTYRTMAIYSLLRTLSTTIRLSPFPPQSFIRALQLPMPSKLLGEIHVRIIRLLYASVGWGCYSKLGDGSKVGEDEIRSLIHRRRKVERKKKKKRSSDDDGDKGGDKDDENDVIVEYEDIWTPRKGCDNLFFLDYTTWPLYFRDYALMMEDKFIFDTQDDIDDEDDNNHDDDEDNYVNVRSVAMTPMETISMKPVGPPKFKSKSGYDDEDEKWISRCPVGPLGRRNVAGRFICCPFHVAAARKMYNSLPPADHSNTQNNSAMYNASSSTTPTDDDVAATRGTKKRGRPSKKSKRKSKKRNDSDSSSEGSDDSDDEDSPTPPDQKKARNDTAVVKKQLPAPTALVNQIGYDSVGQPSGGVSGDGVHRNMAVSNPLAPLAPIPTPLNSAGVQTISNSGTNRVMVPVAPIAPLPVDNNALLIPKDVDDTLTRYFKDGDLFNAQAGIEDEGSEDGDLADDYASPFQNTKPPPSEDLLSHMAPIELMEKGIPYHHLSVESKLQILEFLLDELLATDAVGVEMARRHVITENYNFPYGRPPLPHEYEGIFNQDDCAVCQLGGDLLCCDRCPGSYHRQCIGMEPNRSPPEGRWLCPECSIADPAKLAPLSLPERRPLLGWFTLDELDTKEVLVVQHQPLAPNPAQMIGPFVHDPLTGQPHQMALNAANQIPPPPMQTNSKIPKDVEFLVSSGKVFARYRSSQLPFDPLKISESDDGVVDLTLGPESSSDQVVSTKISPPPVALTDNQVIKLVKLLGPALCLNYPWRQIQFTPQRVFGMQPMDQLQVNPSLQLLAHHQGQAREDRIMKVDMYNPMTFQNGYRRAPHPASMNALPGAAGVFLLVPSVHYYPISTPLSIAMVDPTIERFGPIDLPYRDHMTSIRDKMIQMERALYDACLVDMNWGLDEDIIDLEFWQRRVHKAKSVKRLSFLLVELIDACCIRAFHSEWYALNKEALVHDGSKPINIGKLADFNPQHGIHLRRWERMTGADIFRYDAARLSKIFDLIEPRGKRKKRKISNDGNDNTSTKSAEESDVPAGLANNDASSKSNVVCEAVESDAASKIAASEVATTTDDDVKPEEDGNPTEQSKLKEIEETNEVGASDHPLPPPPTTTAVVPPVEGATTEKKASKYCIYEGCMKYKQSGTFGYCLTHKSHADPAKVAAHKAAKIAKAKGKETKSVVKGKRSRKSIENPSLDADLRRRSDRLHAMRRELMALLRKVGADADDSGVAELRLSMLEKVLGEDDFKAEYFAIAGRKLFEPAGSLSLSVTKRLGRTAGSTRVPTLRYDSAYEVAETTHCHNWRKKTLQCTTYEELIHSLRFLEAHLDNSTITKCQNIAKRKAAQPLKTTEIRCKYLDPATGFTEYFVVPVNRIRGVWYSEANIDENNLILYRYDQRKLVQRNKRPPKPPTPPPAPYKPRPTPPKAKVVTNVPNSMLPVQNKTLQSYVAMYNGAVQKHKMDTFELLKQSAARGEKSVSVAAIGEARKVNVAVMRRANANILKHSGKQFRKEQEVTAALSQAEAEAVKLYIAEAQKKKNEVAASKESTEAEVAASPTYKR